jgi:dsRNA-specific ribonuclease
VAIIDGDVHGEGEGASRRTAEQHAARRAMRALEGRDA